MKSAIDTPESTAAFTLVELLVVITIIVILLALLAPAMDQALYQGELAVCGSRQHGIATGALNYAINNRNRYPHRPALRASNDRVIIIRATFFNANFADDRPFLRDYMDVNGHLNCPLTQEVDLEDNYPDTALFSPIALWFGTRYTLPSPQPNRGMFKIGDRFTVEDKAFNILAGDWDGVYLETSPPHHFSTHPDREGIMWDWVQQDSDFTNAWTGGPQTRTPGLQVTWSYWHSPNGVSRGILDNNYAFDDGSVVRYSDVPPYAGSAAAPVEPEGWVWVPSYQSGNSQATYKVQLPRPR
jgi:prepilin-type N-terminal cleavage/methylation domain-containing protein